MTDYIDVPKTPEDLEIERVTRLGKSFNFLNKQWIGVSFVHMAIIMLMFSAHGGGLIGIATTVAVLVMVLGIDLALMWLSQYIAVQKQYRQPVGFWAWIAFVMALLVEWTFNTGALWANMPAAEKFPPVLSQAISITFGTFVALIIYVSATIPTRLARTALFIAEDAQRRKNSEAERQRNRDEAERKRCEKEASITIRDVPFVPLESHNETVMPQKQLPDSAPTLAFPSSNGKAAFSTSDVPAIIKMLYGKRVQTFGTATELAQLCGWASPSSGAKALEILHKNGVVAKSANGWKVNWKIAQPLMLATDTPDKGATQ